MNTIYHVAPLDNNDVNNINQPITNNKPPNNRNTIQRLQAVGLQVTVKNLHGVNVWHVDIAGGAA